MQAAMHLIRRHRAIPWLLLIALTLGVLSLTTNMRLWQSSSPDVHSGPVPLRRVLRAGTDEQSEPATLPRHSRDTFHQLAKLSCFDTPIGEKLGGIVPVVDVPPGQKREMRSLWEKMLRSEHWPENAESVQWRKILWTQIEWETPPKRGKYSEPRTIDAAATWHRSGRQFTVASGEGVTMTLHADEELTIPSAIPDQGVNEATVAMDKSLLFRLLTGIFNFSWGGVGDFEVIEGLSPTRRPLRVESTPDWLKTNPNPCVRRVRFEIAGRRPQCLTVFPPVACDDPDQ